MSPLCKLGDEHVRGLFVCVLLIFCLGSGRLAQAQSQRLSFQVRTSIKIQDKWTSKLRQRAIQAAFRRALEFAFVRAMRAQERGRVKATLDDLREQGAARYIYGFRVLSESIAVPWYRMTVLVYVDWASLLRVLQSKGVRLRTSAPPPRRSKARKKPATRRS